MVTESDKMCVTVLRAHAPWEAGGEIENNSKLVEFVA